MAKMSIKSGDTVVITTGKNKGKKGKVLAVSPKEGKIIVEKCKMVKKHVKPKKAGDPAGIVNAESAFYACKAAIVCPKCNKPTRVGHQVMEDGAKERICRKCGKAI